jgi:hypothetical protein
MAEIDRQERETAERDTYFKDTDTGKTYQRVRDNAAIIELQSIVSLLNISGLAWTKSTLTIPANSTVTADVTLLSSFNRIDYILDFVKVSDSSTKSMTLIVQNNAGTVSDSVTNRLGGSINLALNVTQNLVDEFLDVTNNESSALTLTMLKAVT